MAVVERPLLGRDAECRRIDEMLRQARAGESGALLIRGEPGIGKSALLAYTRERAGDMVVLTARGHEAESELPFATLDQLLRPLLGGLESIPPPQAASLASALGLGPPAPTDRFAVGAATLSLLAAAAEELPLLALVDDAHWTDPSSLDALLFAVRRLSADPVAVVLALRDGGRTLPASFAELLLKGLTPDACREVLARRRDRPVAAPVAELLWKRTRGNPLALVQLASVLTDEQLAGHEPLPEPLPAVAIEDSFLDQVRRLPRATQRLLAVAAANDSGSVTEVLVAAGVLAIDGGELVAAERAGLVAVAEDELRFQHPLLRSAVYHAVSPEERRAIHRALAGALQERGQSERSAWHLAEAAFGSDEQAAAALEAAGRRAHVRSDYAAAAAAFERAARLTADSERRASRLLVAAEAAFLAGRLEVIADLVDEALHDIEEPARRAAAKHLRAVVDLWQGKPRIARELLRSEAERISQAEPSAAASMLFDATIASVMAFDPQASLEIAERAFLIAHDADENVQALAKGVLATSMITRGRAVEALPLLEQARWLVEAPSAGADPQQAVRHFIWHFYIFLERYTEAARLFDSSIDGARAASAPSLLPFPLAFRAELRFRTGRWHDAYADAAESVRLAEETGQSTQLSHSLATLARIEAGQGREDDCRAHCARALDLARGHGSDAILVYTGSALGLLELGLGDPARSIVELEPLLRLYAERGVKEPGAVPWGADLVEAYIRASRLDDADSALASLEQEARRAERTWALAACARCRGLLVTEDAFDGWFSEALTWHERTSNAFERARTELCHGERLRRARRLVEARRPLHDAAAVFEALGARPWLERARVELRASGEAPRTPCGPNLEELTAQEIQVARVIAEGARNREAAAALFLSPKTIDFHLRNIYRKLGIRSRSELASLIARDVRTPAP